jgi:hypothetical protein
MLPDSTMPLCACGCGHPLPITACARKRRRFISGHNMRGGVPANKGRGRPLTGEIRICACGCGESFAVRRKYPVQRFMARHNGRRPDIPFADWFWSQVDKTGDCWLWKGGRSIQGYGDVRIDPRGPTTPAHRVSYELTYGPLGPGMLSCHHCDNPPCVRPDHLFAGTVPDNNRDCWAKGRHKITGARRMNTYNAHLTPDLVREIRARFKNGSTNKAALARQYHVGPTAIERLVRFHSWRWVT